MRAKFAWLGTVSLIASAFVCGTGAQAQEAPEAQVDGDADTDVILVTGSRLVLLDGTGRQVREWPLSLGVIDDNTWLTTSAGHVLLFGAQGMLLGVTG